MADNVFSTLLIDTMTSGNNISFTSDHVNTIEKNMSDSEDDTQVTITRIKGKLPQFTSSDSDTDKENKCKSPPISSRQKQASDDDNNRISTIVPKKKSRIRNISNSNSDTDNENKLKNPFMSSPLNQASDDDNNRISSTVLKKKSRIRNFSNSDSDTDKNHITSLPLNQSSGDDDRRISSTGPKKKSIIKNLSNSESESQLENESPESRNKYDLTRTKIKSKKLKDKFKKLKNTVHSIVKESDTAQSDLSHGKSSNGSDVSDEENSCLKIKEKLMKKSTHSLASICDPDTSDEESSIKIRQPKSRPKSTKLTSPKPIRMSAKQAMENMQKIKSESNRMLREKEVSLPYHRPKALNLKDIMSRRRPAITSDGKSLPIKMNSEQLKQYASLLEQRQKEMMELCKSDTEEEEENSNHYLDKKVSSDISNKSGNDDNCGTTEVNESEENCMVSSEINDKTFDDIIMEEKVNESKTNTLDQQVVKESIDTNNFVHENDREQKKSDNTETVPESTTEQEVVHVIDTENIPLNEPLKSINSNQCTEEESQVISLHYDTDKTEVLEVVADNGKNNANKTDDFDNEMNDNINEKGNLTDEFSDNDFVMEELDSILENAEINKDVKNKPLSNIQDTLRLKPKLTGGPGMVINLDDDDSDTPKKLTGVELLKERFTYFVKLKSLEDKEKDREKKFKPGIQHLKLKHELEEQIAEQRSIEWEKRLEEERKLKTEMNEDDNDEEFDGENIEKIEAKLEESEVVDEEESSSGEEEDDIDISEKPRKRNPLVDDEADVSEDETAKNEEDKTENEECENDNDEENDEDGNNSDSEEDDTSESEEDEEIKPKKGRILKAFEDSDDDEPKYDSILTNNPKNENKSNMLQSQDDDIQLAQPQRSFSEDLFTSQECSQKSINMTDKPKDSQNNTSSDNDLGTQTFSILQSGCEDISNTKNTSSEKLDIICESQPCSYDNFDAIVGMCTGNFTENLVTPQSQSSQLSQSQLGDDVAAMCTGKFYDNPLISQSIIDNEISDENNTADDSMNVSYPETQRINVNSEIMAKKTEIGDVNIEAIPENITVNKSKNVNNSEPNINVDKVPKNSEDISNKVNEGENRLLKSILDELDDPEFDLPKPNKYFVSDNRSQSKDNQNSAENTLLKKKFVIESDEETNGEAEVSPKKKKHKLEDRALQFSDDEEDYSEQEEDTYVSDLEDDNDKNENERLVEYDSEENEVEIQVKTTKKKRLGKDFFEQEAELTSEDEWIGSGDEDEAGLDRMEREEGDDDTFHQGKLQRELGEIHMREVLDQDKREVRLLQELLFEDGDLGDGHRQRKFRWKNADGEDEVGTNADEYADTQEDEFESEEQWRKQRHEREMFLKKLQEKDEKDASISINRSALIKATLVSKTPINVTENVTTDIDKPKLPEAEKKIVNDVPLAKEPFIIFQQSYHNSLLTRGRGALARLAALATPLAGDGDDTPKVNASSSRGNFVFAAITPDDAPKVTKRKADANPDTPRLLKKMRKQDCSKNSKTSLLDHL